MKKIISIRALLIALMLTFTFAIPALASVKTQAEPVEADQAVPTEPVTETTSIDIAAPTSDAAAAVETEVIDNKIDTVSEETDDVIEETAEEVVETASEVEAEDPPHPLLQLLRQRGSQLRLLWSALR